jgi:hypothetical protein
MWFKRMLHYQEKHGGWAVFRTVYWSIYLLMLSLMLVYYGVLGLTLTSFFGIILFILSIMVIVFGFTQSLHYKLMRRIG